MTSLLAEIMASKHTRHRNMWFQSCFSESLESSSANRGLVMEIGMSCGFVAFRGFEERGELSSESSELSFEWLESVSRLGSNDSASDKNFTTDGFR